MDIADWREKIDAIDLQIVALLSERAVAAQAIGKLKQSTNLPVYEPNRERVIFDRVRAANKGPLPDIELVHIYERIIDVMRALQQDELASQKIRVRQRAGCTSRGDRKAIMIVAMQEHASEEQIQSVTERLLDLGFKVHRTTGTVQTILAGVGTPAAFDVKDFRGIGGRSRSLSHLIALQARGPQLQARRHGHPLSKWSYSRRQRSRRHGRAMFGREPRANLRSSGKSEGRRRKIPSRRSIQAAQLAVFVSGHGS